jgi:putative FmdB family regulatory protein
MPLYDYACDDCGTNFERLIRRDSELSDVDCPGCGTSRVHRQLSLPAAPIAVVDAPPSACGSGPPCGAPWCQRNG